MATKIGLFFGTTTGKTEAAADLICEAFGGKEQVALHDIARAKPEDFAPYAYVIVGCPTWNIGELQGDWESFFEELESVAFAGKKVAYFGTGDQMGYGSNFQDAMGILERKISALGGQTVGLWPNEGYDFDASEALRGDKFCGLALDEDNQSELTEGRIQTWVAQLKQEFGL
ncbi:MAG TPA: flavodoxin FldA [Cyanobacteria bacterium UBA8156]|nr:flavodoxin FldA [Cyanobacteria bacterium UBA8156]